MESIAGIGVAAVATGLHLAAVTAVVQLTGRSATARLLLILFLAIAPAVAIAALAAQSVPLLQSQADDEPAWLVIGLTMFVYVAAFFGGTLQLYNLAERGYSLRVLIDVRDSSTGELSEDEIYRLYGGGRGIAWMYQKRLDDLASHDLVAIDGVAIRLTERGWRLARLYGALRQLFRVESAL